MCHQTGLTCLDPCCRHWAPLLPENVFPSIGGRQVKDLASALTAALEALPDQTDSTDLAACATLTSHAKS